MKDILKYIIWGGLFAVLIIPFIVADSMFFPYITGKAFTFRIIVEVVLGLWLILIIKDEEFRPKFSWILTSALIFTVVLFLADALAVAPYKAFWSNFERMEGWVTIAHLFAYILVLGSMFKTEKMWLWFLRANVVAGLVMAISSLDKTTEVRFSGPLGNPIYISVYFLFIFFFTVLLWHKDTLVKNLTDWQSFKRVFRNILFYIYPLSAALSFYVTYRTSRGVLLGLIGGLLVATILIAIFETSKVVIRHISFVIIGIIIITVVGFLSARETPFVQNNPTLSRLASVSWSNVSGQARQYIWPMAIKGFQEKPILGWGQEGFNYVFNKYYDPRMYDQEQWFDRVHNTPLDFLIAGGLLGLLSYLALFGLALYLLWFRKNNIDTAEKAIVTGLFVGYFFQGLFVFDNLISYIMFFTTLAFIHSRLVEREERQGSFLYFKEFISNVEYQNYILIPVIIALTAYGVWWINIPSISANKNLINALQLGQSGDVTNSIVTFKQALDYHSLGDSEIREQLLSLAPAVSQATQIDSQTREDFVNLATSEGDKQIAMVPADARYYILMGAALNGIGAYGPALPYIEKAIALSPAKQTMHFQLIFALANLGKDTEALAEAKATYELDKNYDQAKSLYKAVIENVIKHKPSFKAEGDKLIKDLLL